MKFVLEKVLEPGTWRFWGQRCLVENPHDIPIAGDSIESIQRAINGRCYRIGRVNVKNAFLMIVANARLLYVRPHYRAYRKLGMRVFSPVPWQVDFDHALSRNIALKANPVPNYVLLLRVPPPVNRQHGLFEKLDQLPSVMPSICLADLRVWDKWLGRSPKSRNRPPEIMKGYSPLGAVLNPLGLTLKQLGQWAYAVGMGDEDMPMDNLFEFDPS